MSCGTLPRPIDISPHGPYRTSSSMRGKTFRPLGGDHVAVLSGDESRHDISCFADEVVIDFPSIAPALDRMRRAFLADERPITLRAAIQLSEREAVKGVTMPLAVAVRCTCGHCGGRGESWTERCARCGGNGLELLRHLLHVTVPAGILDGTRFYFTVTPRHNPPTRIELHVLVA
jgi:tRNA(Ile2) C34 agmatinyltransferase TiaS